MTPLDREWIDRCSYCRQCTGVDLGEGCTPSLPPPPRDDLRPSNTTGILQNKKRHQSASGAAPPKKNPGSAPGVDRCSQCRQCR